MTSGLTTLVPDPARRTGLVLVLVTAMISGLSVFVNSYAVGSTSSNAFVTVRNLVVALALVGPVLFVAQRTAFRPTARQLGLLAVLGLIGGSVPFLLYFRGLQLATAAGGFATAAFLYRTLFLWAGLAGFLLLRERLGARAIAAGAVLLVGNVLLLDLTRVSWTDGTAYVLAATGLWTLEYTLARRMLRDLPSGVVALGRMGFGAVFLVGFLAVTSGTAAVGAFSGTTWSWIAISALLLTGFVATWYAGLKRVELGVAASVLNLGYPVTLAAAYLVRGIGAPWVPALGGVFVTAAVVVLVLPGLWPRSTPAPGTVAPPAA